MSATKLRKQLYRSRLSLLQHKIFGRGLEESANARVLRDAMRDIDSVAGLSVEDKYHFVLLLQSWVPQDDQDRIVEALKLVEARLEEER